MNTCRPECCASHPLCCVIACERKVPQPNPAKKPVARETDSFTLSWTGCEAPILCLCSTRQFGHAVIAATCGRRHWQTSRPPEVQAARVHRRHPRTRPFRPAARSNHTPQPSGLTGPAHKCWPLSRQDESWVANSSLELACCPMAVLRNPTT